MRNIAEINLENLYRNAAEVKKRLPENVRFCAVVKADAYGHGAAECAAKIYKLADCFAVALVEEGVTLRQSGIDKDVLILIPVTKEEIAVAVRNNFTLSVQSVSDVKLIEKECRKQKRRVKVHVAVNSGMNRLGANLDELDEIVNELKKCKYLFAEGVFSHYACPENERRRKAALKIFKMAAEKVKKINPAAIKHISASGGFLKGDYLDMVRVGILLYGYKPFKDKINVKPVMKVISHSVMERTVNCGELAGYGDKPLKKRTRFTVVRAGYADGLLRQKTKGLVNNRCMDTSLVSDFDGVVMDDAEKIARQTGTISYEVLCAATVRADKKYIR